MKKRTVYAEAFKQASANTSEFKLAALLWRGGTLIHIGVNNNTHRKGSYRVLNDGVISRCKHAEIDAIRTGRAQPGDRIEIIRYKADGSTSCAKPCPNCAKQIKKAGIISVKYTDYDGNWSRMSL